MGGGLMQLVAYGAQDVYLTSDPQVTFFKVVYRRHTNFAMEAIEQTFNGNPDFGKKVSVTVSRNGDLIGRAYLVCTLPAVVEASSGSGFAWVSEPGHFLIKNVEVEIGGQRIDKHYSEWLSIYNSLVLPTGQSTGYNNMIGNTSDLVGTFPGFASGSGSGETIPSRKLYVPLQFWFNRNPGLYLPLIALQYHEVKLNFEFRTFAELHRGVYNSSSTTTSLTDASVFIDYVFLDTDERRKFAQYPHEYLIEQLQFQGDESLSGLNNKVKLTLNHPVKELVWVVQRDDNVDTSSSTTREYLHYANWTDAHTSAAGSNPVDTAKLQLNGYDRFSQREGRYFNYVQPYQHHKNTPSTGINVYSFAINPEEHQPSGSSNMSRIDNASLLVNLSSAMSGIAAKIKVFAVNYNVLRVVSGMGGLAYAS